MRSRLDRQGRTWAGRVQIAQSRGSIPRRSTTATPRRVVVFPTEHYEKYQGRGVGLPEQDIEHGA